MLIRIDDLILRKDKITNDQALKLIADQGLISHLQGAVNGIKLDANETYFTARELVNIKQKAYDVLYPELKGDYIVPVDSEGDTGADTLGYDQFDKHGEAGILNDEGEDYRQVEISKTQTVHPVRTLGAYIEWTLQDIRRYSLSQRSQLASSNASLTEKKTRSAIKAVKLKEENIIAQGDEVTGLIGFYNNSEIPAVTLAADGTGSSDAWEDKTPKQIIRDLNQLVNKVITQSNGIFVPNTIVMPVALYTLIASTPYEGSNGTAIETILSFFLKKSHPDKALEVIPYDRVNWGATANHNAIICYYRHPDVLAQMIPQPLEVFGPQQKATTFKVFFRERYGGVHLRYPIGCAKAEIDQD